MNSRQSMTIMELSRDKRNKLCGDYVGITFHSERINSWLLPSLQEVEGIPVGAEVILAGARS